MTFRQFACNNVTRKTRTYAAYFLSSAFSVMIFFVYAMFIFHPNIEKGMISKYAAGGMKAAEYIIFVFSFFFILYSVSAFLQSRKREFGILMMHGMTKRQLNRLIFLENMLIGTAAIIVGIGIGLIFAKAFLLIGASILDVNEMPFYLSWKAVLLTFASFIALFLIISTLTSVFIRTNKIIDLLNGSQKPKPEPKASITLSIVAVVLLISGYALSCTTTEQNLNQRIMIVPIIVIIGTYFLFDQLSVYTIRVLKKNLRFYRKQTNIIVLSDLAYRMKDNARMFFLVTIVSTVAFCGVGAFAAMGTLTKMYEINYPFAITYVSDPGNPKEKRHLSIIEHDLHHHHLHYTKAELTVKSQTSATTKNTVTLIKVSDFNRFARLLNVPGLSLKHHEAHVIPSDFEQRNDLTNEPIDVTLKESHRTVHVNGSVKKPIFSPYSLGSNLLVVSDKVFSEVKKPSNQTPFYPKFGAKYIGYKVADWKETNQIGTKITDERDAIIDKGGDTAFYFSSAGSDYLMTKQLYNVSLFIGLLIGAVFYIAAGSFLYFRLYTDLENDKRKYRAIAKIGMTEKELSKIATTELALMFFIPIMAAIIHSCFAFVALQSLFHLSIVRETMAVLVGFIIAQVLYFSFIRSRYLRHLKEVL
ncbi:ABC transporter permease [Fictibacillus gelatini]|uniref:ABC transporter permease n=1 Tax=Fictibacillus gelatini TaxID=225985 RepID=UPI000411BC2D|nr:ABC transporter permease [Fictibacillus gelatini]